LTVQKTCEIIAQKCTKNLQVHKGFSLLKSQNFVAFHELLKKAAKKISNKGFPLCFQQVVENCEKSFRLDKKSVEKRVFKSKSALKSKDFCG